MYGNLKLVGDRVQGWLIRYGHKMATDLTHEWFTPDTYLGLDVIKALPMLYHHGLDEEMGDDPIGLWDTFKAIPDEGLWVEGQLDLRRKYIRLVKRLLDAQALGLSSGTFPHLCVKAPDGEIKKWVLREGSLTATPAEYTALVKYDTLIKAYTVLGLSLDAPPTEQPEADPSQGEGGQPVDVAPIEPETVKSTGVVEVEPKEFTAEDLQKAANAAAIAALAMRDEQEAKRNQPDAAADAHLKKLPPRGGNPIEGMVDTSQVITVTRGTKYGDFSPSDMSFMADVLAQAGTPVTSDSFYRELADKTVKAINTGKLHPAAAEGLIKTYGASFKPMDVAYRKSNEVANTGQASYGTEWAPDSWRAELWYKVRQENVVAPAFSMLEMPTQPYELPIEGTDPTVFYLPETADLSQIADTSAATVQQTKIGSGKVQMSAKKLGLRVLWSGELNEDSIIPVLSQYRGQAIRAMQDAVDYVLLLGDTVTAGTGNINLVDAAPPTYSKYLAFNGIMKSPLVTTTANKYDINGTVTLEKIRRVRFLMSGQYALRNRDLALFCDDSTYAQLLNMDEFITMDKAGIYATNLTGQLGVIDGMGVFPTAQMPLANSDGKIPNAGGTLGRFVIASRPGWLVGYRRQVQTEVERKGASDAYQLILTARLCLVQFDTEVAACGYNITV